MDLTQVTILVLLGILGNLRETVSSCKFGANCDYPCHCQDNAVCDVDDGSCPNGCDDGDLRQPGDYWYTGGWSGYGCQIGNVAYSKSATAYGNRYPEWPATNAVDGGHNPDISGGSCAHPGPSGSAPAWWEVDLGTKYVLLSINITNRQHSGQRTAHMDIYVSDTHPADSMGTVCNTILAEGARDNTYVNCTEPVIGRHVRLKRHTGPGVYQSHWMNICEVQVYGYLYHDCPDDYFGVACGTACNCRGPCDDINGECSSGECLAGWMGSDCQTPCRSGYFGEACATACNCRGRCDHINGECRAGQCLEGWVGSNCQTPCPDGYFGEACATPCNCGGTCDHIDGECRTGQCLEGWRGSNCQTPCANGKWGAQCLDVCHCSDEQEPCNRFNGHCQSGCHMNYGGLGCNLVLPILDSVINMSSASQTSLTIRFEAWSSNNGVGDTPTGYEIQWRLDGSETWIPSLQLQHNGSAEYIAMLKDLEPDTLYYINIIPYIEEGGISYLGFAKEAGPFRTLGAANHNANIVGVVVALVFVLILTIVIVLLFRRHLANRKGDNRTPVIFGARKSSLNGTDGQGNEGPVYTEIDEVTNKDVRRIKVDELSAYIDKTLSREDGFREEFMQIPTSMAAVRSEAGKKMDKTPIYVNDDPSRVVLKASSDEDRSGYDANYVHKYKDDPKGYIAARGPKEDTVIDMWTMVWESESNRIVMVTNLHEAGKVKCEQYWPSQTMMEVGKFSVSLVDTEKFADYTIRVFSLSYDGGKSRNIYQFHFTGWPENHIPDEATSLLDFRRKVRSHDNVGKGPIIVHCSSGAGRTGTFMALDYLLDQAKSEGIVDVFTYTALMRTSRLKMIQTVEQYAFVYKALLEALQTGETAVSSNEMKDRYHELTKRNSGKSVIEEQFALLHCLKPARKLSANDGAMDLDNIAKNRDRTIVPTNKYRPYLCTSEEETSDYINAVFVDGYRDRQAYIATQLPLTSTVADLWRLLCDHECKCIIALEYSDPDDEDTPVFWPTVKGDPVILDQLSVTLLKEKSLCEGAVNMMEFEVAPNNKDSRNVRMYHFLSWSTTTETPTSLENTLMLLDHAQRWQLCSGLGPLCFLCKYGYERSGLMVAACYLLEKLKVDREVDVFQTVKQVRVPRPELVTSLAQYEFLHELAIAYINSCEDYENFK